MASQKKIYTNCNDCKKTTNHDILFCKRFIEYDDYYKENSPYYKYQKDFMTIQCGGCDSVSFLIRHTGGVFSNGFDNSDYFDQNFPNRENELDINLLSEDEQSSLPKMLQELYSEVEGAFKEEASILAGVGLRMLVEGVCLERKISGRTLQDKIKNLHSEGLLSANEIPILDKLRLIGNFSAHEIKGFSIDKLEYALDIINHILKSIYILPKINKMLKI